MPDAQQKDVAKSYRLIEKFLQENASHGTETVGVIHVTDYLRRFCSSLGLSHTDMRHCTDIANAASPRDGRCCPLFLSEQAWKILVGNNPQRPRKGKYQTILDVRPRDDAFIGLRER